MIKLIVFDVGKVLVKESGKAIHKKIEKKFRINQEQFQESRKRYMSHALIRKKRDFWYEKKIAKDLGLDFEEFLNYWQKIRQKGVHLSKTSKNLLIKIKKNYKIATLTDVTHSHEVLRTKNKIYDLFDFNIKSLEVNAKKPDKKIYKILIKKSGLKPEEIIFIDDLKENLIEPKKLGIKTIHFKDNRELKNKLRSYGIKW